MPAVDFKFNTSAELAGARAIQQQLERQIGQAKALGKDYKDLEAQLAKVNERIKASGQAGGFKDLIAQVPGLQTVGRVLEALSTRAGILASSIGAAAFALKAGVDEFAKAERQVASLDAALAQNGLLTDENRKKYQDLASQLQDLTAIADDEWIGVLSRLTQFGSRPETIGIDVEAVKNLAALMGGDLRSAAVAYSRALQGSFDLFSRYGILLDQNATSTEKLKQLQEDLAKRGGGQLEAMANTLSGQFGQLKNRVGDFFEAIGRGISKTGTLQAVLGGLGDSINWLGGLFGGLVPKTEGLQNKIEATTASLEEMEAATRQAAIAEEVLKTKMQGINDALSDRLRLTKEIERRTAEQIDANLAQDLAKIDVLEAQKKVTPEQAIQLRAGARTTATAARTQAQTSAIQEEIAAREAAIKDRRGAIETAQSEVSTATGRLQSVRNLSAARSEANQAREFFERLRKEMKDLLSLRQIARPQGETDQEIEALFLPGLHARQAQLTRAKARAAQAKSELPPGAADSLTEEVAQQQLAAAQQRLQGLLGGDEISKLTSEIAQLRAEIPHIQSIGNTGLTTSSLGTEKQMIDLASRAAEERKKAEEGIVQQLTQLVNNTQSGAGLREMTQQITRIVQILSQQQNLTQDQLRRLEAQIRDSYNR